MLSFLLEASQGNLSLNQDAALFQQFEGRFIEAETDPFGVRIWTDRVKKPFPVTTLPLAQLSRVAQRFPEGSYLVVIKLNNDPNGKLSLLTANREGLKNLFESEFEELYISDLAMTWLLYAKVNENDLVELVGSGDVCPIR